MNNRGWRLLAELQESELHGVPSRLQIAVAAAVVLQCISRQLTLVAVKSLQYKLAGVRLNRRRTWRTRF